MFANGSFLPLRSARRSATVTISVPLAANASRIASGDENLPVPIISRDRNSRPAILNGHTGKCIRSSLSVRRGICRVWAGFVKRHRLRVFDSVAPENIERRANRQVDTALANARDLF